MLGITARREGGYGQGGESAETAAVCSVSEGSMASPLMVWWCVSAERDLGLLDRCVHATRISAGPKAKEEQC